MVTRTLWVDGTSDGLKPQLFTQVTYYGALSQDTDFEISATYSNIQNY